MSDRRWTIAVCGECNALHGDPPTNCWACEQGRHLEPVDVMPVPDDAAVERVARGLAIVDGSPDHHWRDYVFNARAVLAALMSPEP